MEEEPENTSAPNHTTSHTEPNRKRSKQRLDYGCRLFHKSRVRVRGSEVLFQTTPFAIRLPAVQPTSPQTLPPAPTFRSLSSATQVSCRPSSKQPPLPAASQFTQEPVVPLPKQNEKRRVLARVEPNQTNILRRANSLFSNRDVSTHKQPASFLVYWHCYLLKKILPFFLWAFFQGSAFSRPASAWQLARPSGSSLRSWPSLVGS